ncbi:hypothetical protein [Variovorax paradoxus]|uniref:hypothetical protein n=1 Tax=Variovorax paradoxus TaxID=34073 RepID=UPI0027820AFB|nr:hypothetical protein [Variovorax paradoxus]MDP9932602.1 hypothetical protein [Variovorax paradoxus]
MSKTPFVIHLGNHWRMFANAREDMTFLGTVQHSVAAIGALARTPDGHYAQVNGDVVAMLHAKKIEGALRKRSAKTQKSQWASNDPSGDRLVADPPHGPRPIPAPSHPPPASACAPVVTVKKRRVAVRATTDASRPATIP